MSADWQFVTVAAAAGAATLYALRQVLLQLQRPDDEPGGCHGCPANRAELGRMKERDDRH